MGTSRREFLAAALAASVPPIRSGSLFNLNELKKFVDPLPLPPQAIGREAGGVTEYRITMRAFRKKCHRDLPPATFWGYDGFCPGPLIEARRNKPVAIEWVNALPDQHLFAVDHTLHGAERDEPAVRTVTHLHGASAPPESDGYPENWFTRGQSARYLYPNRQNGATLFYHDHAMGITRLNTAAGLMGLYILRDEEEETLGLPGGGYEIPLVLFDRSFRADGQIFYPVSSNAAAPWVSEYYGGGILANGALFPYLAVEPALYRFRVLNSSNGSFYKLALMNREKRVPYYVIGGDQGLLPAPVQIESLILGPGERTDLLIDFTAFRSGELRLRTDTAELVQFRVSGETTAKAFKIPATLRKNGPLAESDASETRLLTLGDMQDRLGRSHMMLLNGCHWDMPVTEKPRLHSTEIWSFLNLTDDSHPIHLHLVKFQVLDRRKFDLAAYQLTKQVVYTEPAMKPEGYEAGWKDTVRVDPNTVTRIIAKFEPYAGRYVWHCHMLEHEDNEMMRPYEVVG